MHNSEVCSRCGAALGPDSPDGLCAPCLLESALTGLADDELSLPRQTPGPFPTLLGDYELLAEIARGGMGVVFRARQRSLDRIVAVKLILVGQWASPAQVERFKAEATAAARLDHPNIVPIYEIGEANGQHFFSMKLIEGGPLTSSGQATDQVACCYRPEDAAALVATIARAVHYAHQRGVLHRDLKPTNILLDAKGEPHLTDFGLAKILEVNATMTQAAAVLGTPAYMAPEQAGSGPVTVAADIYSLGAVLYQFLTGQPPFRADSTTEVLRAVAERDPVSPRILAPSLNRDLETICLKCLHKDPAGRYASAEALADDLERWRRGEPVQARPVGVAERLGLWARRRPAIAALAALSVVLGLVVFVGIVIAAILLQRANQQVRQAEHDVQERLWAVQLAQARVERRGDQPGRRTRALATLEPAAHFRPTLELRNEAIATLALTDLEEIPESPNVEISGKLLGVDAQSERCAVLQSGGVVEVRDLREDRLLARFTVKSPGVRDAIFSPTGNLLLLRLPDERSALWLLDPNPHELSIRLPPLFIWTDGAAEAAFSADGSLLGLIGADRRVRLFDTRSWEERAAIRHEGQAQRISFSPSGKLLAVGVGAKVQLWDLQTNTLQCTLSGHEDVFALAWFPDDRRLMTATYSGSLCVWDLETGEFRVLAGHASTVSTVAVDARGDLIVSTSYDGTSKLWDGVSGELLVSSTTGLAYGFTAKVDAVLRQSGGNRFGFWPVVRSRSFQNVSSGQRRLNAMSLSAEGRWLATSDGTGWRLLDLQTQREVAFRHSPQAATPLLRPHSQELLTLGRETLLRWPLRFDPSGAVRVGEPETLLIERGALFQRASVTPDGRWLGIAGHVKSCVIDLQNPSNVVPFSRNRSQSYVAMAPDGAGVVGGSFFDGVTGWDARTGEFGLTVTTNRNSPVAFSPDGHWLATSAPSECCLWDKVTRRLHHRFPSNAASVEGGAIAFSGDSRILAWTPRGLETRLIDVVSGEELGTLTAPQLEKIASLAWSADGSRLVAMTPGNVVQVWNLTELRAELARLRLDWQPSEASNADDPTGAEGSVSVPVTNAARP